MSGHPAWPAIPLAGWRETRETLHQRARVIGAIPRALADPHPHWWHISLRPRPGGLSTVAMQAGRIVLDLHGHTIRVRNRGTPADLPIGAITSQLSAAFDVPLKPEDFASPERYDRDAVEPARRCPRVTRVG